jgi:cytochrome c
MKRYLLSFAATVLLLSVATYFYVAEAHAGRERQAYVAEMTGGDPVQGRELMVRFGCGACHTISGVPGAEALVGPPLSQMAQRSYIAGVLTNTPEHMIRWIQNPPGVDPLTAMPNLRVSETDARSIAAYLYSLP